MKAKRRLDYKPPLFTIVKTALDIQLDPTNTQVVATLEVRRQGSHSEDLILDGEQLTLKSIEVDGQPFVNFETLKSGLLLKGLPDSFTLKISNTISPQTNTALEGLYLTNGAYCTQCEAEGFRRITYYLDRPDVLSVFTVKVTAPKNDFPFLLSNGNKISEQVTDDAHTVVWHDPFPKPSYLFALVAGNFDLLEDTFVTASGKNVQLQLFVDKGQLDKADFALQSLKRAMKWDEDTFGLEYDLDIYMIVAVDFFNMGAMENKGLNVFNSKFILANNSTATDTDYFNIESVVAHEYFHNWTGNRVTCRDWFQLSLKEGLTVFRDQLFSADMSSPLSTRIDQVKVMREHQFPEDASAMSHPIRPDEVVEMNNFYTVTVYDKGAEVIRMLWNIIGEDAFKQGMRTYYDRHDGQAVTCDDFVDAMQSATDYDLTIFKRWYSQSGTPRVSVSINNVSNKLSINVTQQTLPTASQATKQDVAIVLKPQAYTESGEALELDEVGEGFIQLESGAVVLEAPQGTLSFNKADDEIATATVLANFSSPVIIENTHTHSDLIQIAMHDEDAFNRWDAIQRLYSLAVDQFSDIVEQDLSWLDTVVKHLLTNAIQKAEESAEYLTIPSLESLIQERSNVDVIRLVDARSALCKYLARTHYAQLEVVFMKLVYQQYSYNQEQVNTRKLRKALLGLMAYNQESLSHIETLYADSDNMTDTLCALTAAQHCNVQVFNSLMTDFESKWREDSLVIDKWYGLHR